MLSEERRQRSVRRVNARRLEQDAREGWDRSQEGPETREPEGARTPCDSGRKSSSVFRVNVEEGCPNRRRRAWEGGSQRGLEPL